MTNIQTNTSLESVSNNKQDQLKLRDFNDLKKEDVISSIQLLVASKSINDEITIYPSAEVEDKHFSLSKEKLASKKKEYEDNDSDLSKNLNDEFKVDLYRDAEAQIDISDFADKVSVETELKEISVDEAVRSFNEYSLSLKDHKDVTDIDKNTLISRLEISKNDYKIELVSKDNVPTFVIVKKDKSIKDQFESIRDFLDSTFSDSLKSFKKIDEVMLELYDDERSIYESLKIFLERFDEEVDKDVLRFQEEDIVDDLRKLLKTLKSQSENTSQ
jgi:hypothetical protein